MSGQSGSGTIAVTTPGKSCVAPAAIDTGLRRLPIRNVNPSNRQLSVPADSLNGLVAGTKAIHGHKGKRCWRDKGRAVPSCKGFSLLNSQLPLRIEYSQESLFGVLQKDELLVVVERQQVVALELHEYVHIFFNAVTPHRDSEKKRGNECRRQYWRPLQLGPQALVRTWMRVRMAALSFCVILVESFRPVRLTQ